MAIETRGLTKRFHGTAAVNGLDLRVPRGSVYGFLGPNGAGKTTTIRMLMGLARPTAGEARILGEPAGPGSPAKARLGFLPDVPAFYGWMKAAEYLEFVGRLFGLEGAPLRKRVAELLDFTGLSTAKAKIAGFSRGMKQRLGLAQALVNDPELVILDEPTSALDPIGRHEVLEAVKSLSGKTTVFFSTHILNDVERVADRVAILDKGRLVAEDDIHTLKTKYTRPAFRLRLESGAEEFARALRALPWVEKAEAVVEPGAESGAEPGARSGAGPGAGPGGAAGEVRLLAKDGDLARVAIPRLIGEKGLALEHFEAAEPTLEDIFLRLVGGAGE